MWAWRQLSCWWHPDLTQARSWERLREGWVTLIQDSLTGAQVPSERPLPWPGRRTWGQAGSRHGRWPRPPSLGQGMLGSVPGEWVSLQGTVSRTGSRPPGINPAPTVETAECPWLRKEPNLATLAVPGRGPGANGKSCRVVKSSFETCLLCSGQWSCMCG